MNLIAEHRPPKSAKRYIKPSTAAAFIVKFDKLMVESIFGIQYEEYLNDRKFGTISFSAET